MSGKQWFVLVALAAMLGSTGLFLAHLGVGHHVGDGHACELCAHAHALAPPAAPSLHTGLVARCAGAAPELRAARAAARTFAPRAPPTT